jgi:hypothetical protein
MKIESEPPVSTPDALARALARAAKLSASDPRLAAMLQLQSLIQYAEFGAGIAPIVLGPAFDIMRAFQWTEKGKPHPLFETTRKDTPGARAVFRDDLLSACCAVHYLRKAGQTIPEACANVGRYWGRTAKQVRSARKDFLARRVGTEEMRDQYSRMISEFPDENASQAAGAFLALLMRDQK